MQNAMLGWIEAADARLALQEARIEPIRTGQSAYGRGVMAAALGLIACSALAAGVKPGPALVYAGLMQIMT